MIDESGEWLTPEEFCMRTGYKTGQLKNFLYRSKIPEYYIKRKSKSRHSGIVGFLVELVDLVLKRRAERENRLNEMKTQKRSGNITPEPEQPDNAVHVEDPDGVYPGFWLTPEQAITLAEIRVYRRLHGGGA